MLNSIRKWNRSLLFCWLAATFVLSLMLPHIAFAQSNTYSGWLSVLYGDPPPNSGEAPRFLALLSDGHGTTLATLNMDSNLAESLAGQYVEVTGTASEVGAQALAPTVVNVQSIQAIAPPSGTEPGIRAALSGSQPFINLRCYFPDNFSPTDPDFAEHPVSYYTQLFQNSYPGLNDYWRTMSYNQIDLDGTTTTTSTFTLPHSRAYYLALKAISINTMLNAIASDCFALAEPSVNFLNYQGINIMLNYALDCCAWGGGSFLTLDGLDQYWPITWMPPWGQQYSTLGHEMGHGFGLPHSSGPASNPPTIFDIYISDWDIMSNSSGAHVQPNGVYGFTPPGIIAYHVDLGGWMPANRKATITPGAATTITLEQLRATPSPAAYSMAQIPINGSSTHFYTVEVRTHTGYDDNVPAFGPQAVVLIFEVDTNRQTNAGHALIVDVDFPNGSSNGNMNDAGAMWTSGEKFFDSKNNISFTIGALVGTRYNVTITKESTPNAAPVRDFYHTGTPILRWNPVSWAVGYEVQIEDSTTFAVPYKYEANNLPPSQLSVSPSLPDGIYYWRVCALKTPSSCGSWSTPVSFQINTAS